MLIASKVFHTTPRLKNYGVYPADSVFDAFRVSYKESLSEMNTAEEFYYSNSTKTKPVNVPKLQHIAGVGSSPLVTYNGLGAYFLDKLEDGSWRLEVMPDAIHIRDPFEKASPKKEVTRIQWQANMMAISIAELGTGFSIKGLNEGNSYTAVSTHDGFEISPGTYLLVANGKKFSGKQNHVGSIMLNEFVAPASLSNDMYLSHEPFAEVTTGKPFTIHAKVVGLDTGRVTLQINRMGGQFKIIPMTRKGPYNFIAEVPTDMVTPGMLSYRIVMRKGNEVSVFPGNLKADPSAWDNFSNETWKTYVADANGGLELYNPTQDRGARTYPTFRRGFQTSYVTGEKPGQLIFRMAANELKNVEMMGFQYSFVEKLQGRESELGSFDKIVVRARSANTHPVKAKVVLTFADASSLAASITLGSEFLDIEIPLKSFTPDAAMLMPRPYPGFLPLVFKGAASQNSMTLSQAEKIEITIRSDVSAGDMNKSYNLDVECIWLKKATKDLN
jgi:hypothetical protein